MFALSARRVAAAFEVAVDLPPRGTVDGIDIRAREPLLLIFDRQRYPFGAPQVRSDRRDFPSERLPHLNPVPPNEPPYLCLHRGQLDDYFAGASLVDLVERARRWLSDASAGELIPPGDYFEPTRISVDTHHFVADLSLLDVAATRYPKARATGTHAFYLGGLRTPGMTTARLDRVVARGDRDAGTLESIASWRDDRGGWRPTFGVVAWNPEREDSLYVATLPGTIRQLFDWARGRGIALEQAVSGAVRRYGWDRLVGARHRDAHLLLSVGVRRPRPVLGGSGSRYEWLTFLAVFERPEAGAIPPGATAVHATFHHRPLSQQAATHLSRLSAPERRKVLLLGCGALGSRLALHLGRGGATDLGLCDRAALMPHHFVRHGSSAFLDGQPKTTALHLELLHTFRDESDRPAVEEFRADAIDLILAPERAAAYDLAVDATASTSVSSALVASADWPPRCRVARTEIADEGRLGLTFLEGPGRQPRLDDLRAYLYDLGRTDDRVGAWLGRFREELERGRGPVLEEVELGVGCSSDTTRLDDATVALHAAFCGRVLRTGAPLPAPGLLAMSVLEDEGMLSSRRWEVAVFSRPEIGNRAGWDVRVSPTAHEEMARLAGLAGPDETGGLLLGMVQRKQRVIHVTAILGPSRDSRGTPGGFRRGREGYPEPLEDVAAKTASIIGYVGEWHVHPGGSPAPSGIDKVAVARIREELADRSVPALCVILGAGGSLGGWLEP